MRIVLAYLFDNYSHFAFIFSKNSRYSLAAYGPWGHGRRGNRVVRALSNQVF